MKHISALVALLMLAASAMADDDGVPRRTTASDNTGLSVFVNIGALWADDYSANFYSGRDGNANTIERVLHSPRDGQAIWDHLKNEGCISSSIGTYNDLKVAEYPDMYYKATYQVGLGIRYEYASGFGWLLRFNIAKLQAVGAFNLYSDNSAVVLTQDRYIRCGMLGTESRINIDFAISKTVDLSELLCLELNLGASVNNTKVTKNLMDIKGATWSILDVWNGQQPYHGIAEYDYVNQGGIGCGVFMSGYLGYRVSGVGAVKLGYTCYHSQTTLKGYSAMGWHHCLDLRLEINNFSFL